MIQTTEKAKKQASISIIQNISWIIKFNFSYVPFLTITRIIGFLNNHGSRLLSAYVIGQIIDWATQITKEPNTNYRFLMYALVTYAGYYLIVELAATFRNYGENVSSFRISYAIPQTLLHQKLNSLSIKTLESPQIQNMITRFNENRYVLNQASRNILSIIGIVVSLSIAVIPLINIIPLTVLVLVIAAIPNILVNQRIFSKMWAIDKELTVTARRAGNIMYMLTSPEPLKEVRLLQAYEYLRSFFDKYITTHKKLYERLYLQWSAFDLGNTILKGSVILYALYQIILLAQQGTISIGQIVFYLSAMMLISDHIDSLSADFSSLYGVNLRLSEMRELLEWKEQTSVPKEKMKALKVSPLIKLKNISFKYPGSAIYAIKNLSCEIQPGEKIAIVGENGAGKTTLVKLIANIYPVISGEITVNGQNINSVSPESWYKNLGVLYQDFNHYSDLSASENIALGRITERVDKKRIKEAAQKADADEFILNYSSKYDQILSERYEGGTRPSTGQWQKIAIARFFYRNAPVLILDEPTAAIDAVAEAQIFDRIYSFIEKKTVIIISHRFSTVRKANRILVLDKGEIIEEGTHEQLLARNGKYAIAFNLQAKGYEQ